MKKIRKAAEVVAPAARFLVQTALVKPPTEPRTLPRRPTW
jgi:hypothetical protein